MRLNWLTIFGVASINSSIAILIESCVASFIDHSLNHGSPMVRWISEASNVPVSNLIAQQELLLI